MAAGAFPSGKIDGCIAHAIVGNIASITGWICGFWQYTGSWRPAIMNDAGRYPSGARRNHDAYNTVLSHRDFHCLA